MEPIELHGVDGEIVAVVAQAHSEEGTGEEELPRLGVEDVAAGRSETLVEKAVHGGFKLVITDRDAQDDDCRDDRVAYPHPLFVQRFHHRQHKTHGRGDRRHEYAAAGIGEHYANILRQAAKDVYPSRAVSHREIEAHGCGEAQYGGGVVLNAPAEVPCDRPPLRGREIGADVPYGDLGKHREPQPHQHLGKVKPHVPSVVPARVAVD